jgi:low affinity Fe/Cu permease
MINNDSSEINSLQKEHIRLVKEYQNDKNTTKEKKIETIKKKINKLKNKIGTNRDSLTKATQERNNAISKSEYAKRTLSNRG